MLQISFSFYAHSLLCTARTARKQSVRLAGFANVYEVTFSYMSDEKGRHESCKRRTAKPYLIFNLNLAALNSRQLLVLAIGLRLHSLLPIGGSGAD